MKTLPIQQKLIGIIVRAARDYLVAKYNIEEKSSEVIAFEWHLGFRTFESIEELILYVRTYDFTGGEADRQLIVEAFTAIGLLKTEENDVS